jgi:hypothetical protein
LGVPPVRYPESRPAVPVVVGVHAALERIVRRIDKIAQPRRGISSATNKSPRFLRRFAKRRQPAVLRLIVVPAAPTAIRDRPSRGRAKHITGRGREPSLRKSRPDGSS